jgi:hypothetical protein
VLSQESDAEDVRSHLASEAAHVLNEDSSHAIAFDDDHYRVHSPAKSIQVERGKVTIIALMRRAPTIAGALVYR